MNLNDCYNFNDLENYKTKFTCTYLPLPHGGSDDETTLKRNTESFKNVICAKYLQVLNPIFNYSIWSKN